MAKCFSLQTSWVVGEERGEVQTMMIIGPSSNATLGTLKLSMPVHLSLHPFLCMA
jgi:hypothetical protein